MKAPQNILSLGELADRFGAPLPKLEQAFAAIQPAIEINGIPYFDQADAEKLAESLYAPSREQPAAQARH
jgi:hypothetical protein